MSHGTVIDLFAAQGLKLKGVRKGTLDIALALPVDRSAFNIDDDQLISRHMHSSHHRSLLHNTYLIVSPKHNTLVQLIP